MTTEMVTVPDPAATTDTLTRRSCPDVSLMGSDTPAPGCRVPLVEPARPFARTWYWPGEPPSLARLIEKLPNLGMRMSPPPGLTVT